jgi:hypothetical protein
VPGHDDLANRRLLHAPVSFKNSISREGGSADSGSSKIKMPCRWQRPSPPANKRKSK